MIICSCCNVSEKEVKKILKNNLIESIQDLQKYVIVCINCKGCKFYLEKLIKENK